MNAAALTTALIGWSVAAPRVPAQWHPVPHAAFGAAVAALTRASLGLRPPTLWAGLRWGTAAAMLVVVGVATAAAIPQVRDRMAERTLPAPTASWLLLRIPIGTVWAEEAAYRAALGTVATRAFGAFAGQLIAATAFGLSHVPDARSARESVPATVLATGAAGWIFGRLYSKSGSLAAPMIVHLAINEAGAAAALAVQRRRARSFETLGHARST